MPLAKAAKSNARFDKLLEPGKLIVPSTALIGARVIFSTTTPPFYFYKQKFYRVKQDQGLDLTRFFPHHGQHAS